ncbi:MAG: hypothetical protein CM1200mP2_26290 [Planctomycetaceae bacterium]|nr:MAG: hypothetical protein CM1200mP2_26290 [Planctomycetaceae bacterium]
MPGREVTTTPLQQLFVFNSEFFIRQANVLAKHIDTNGDHVAAISKLYRRVFARKPSIKNRPSARRSSLLDSRPPQDRRAPTTARRSWPQPN